MTSAPFSIFFGPTCLQHDYVKKNINSSLLLPYQGSYVGIPLGVPSEFHKDSSLGIPFGIPSELLQAIDRMAFRMPPPKDRSQPRCLCRSRDLSWQIARMKNALHDKWQRFQGGIGNCIMFCVEYCRNCSGFILKSYIYTPTLQEIRRLQGKGCAVCAHRTND